MSEGGREDLHFLVSLHHGIFFWISISAEFLGLKAHALLSTWRFRWLFYTKYLDRFTTSRSRFRIGSMQRIKRLCMSPLLSPSYFGPSLTSLPRSSSLNYINSLIFQRARAEMSLQKRISL